MKILKRGLKCPFPNSIFSLLQYIFNSGKSGGFEEKEKAAASVNAPATLFGYKFFQNSYGWGADIRITKDGKPLQTEAVCAGDFLAVKDKPEYPEIPECPENPEYPGMPGWTRRC